MAHKFRQWFRCYDCGAAFAAHGNAKRCTTCSGTNIERRGKAAEQGLTLMQLYGEGCKDDR